MITIKPHHFLDMIKLHGAGIEVFVPDKTMGHDFYRFANEIMKNPQVPLTLTTAGDDVCKPCRFYRERCTDAVGIDGFVGKDEYNQTLDTRLIREYSLEPSRTYTAAELCRIFYENPQKIFSVWQEEADGLTQHRHQLFCAGAEQYLAKESTK